MKEAKFYQCEWCCCVGLKEQIEKHEKSCIAKDFVEKSKQSGVCFICKYCFKDKKGNLLCSQDYDLDKKGIPRECQNYEVDIDWALMAESALKLNTRLCHPNIPMRNIPIIERQEKTLRIKKKLFKKRKQDLNECK